MSFHKETETLVKKAIQKEYENACNEWGEKYNSLHEGWAIVKEEIAEAKEGYKGVKRSNKILWEALTRDDIECAESGIELIQDYAYECVLEMLQVIACCRKLEKTLKEKEC